MNRLTTLRFPFVLAGALALAACGALDKPDAGSAAPRGSTPPEASKGADAPAAAAKEQPQVKMVAELEDVPVPRELTRDDEVSFFYEAPGVTVGQVVYEGYYKAGSIARFFRTEMPKYNWRFLNAINESGNHVINFLKQDRSCTVSIEESALSTRVLIRVGPTQAN